MVKLLHRIVLSEARIAPGAVEKVCDNRVEIPGVGALKPHAAPLAFGRCDHNVQENSGDEKCGEDFVNQNPR
jgi:hypothetical protein